MRIWRSAATGDTKNDIPHFPRKLVCNIGKQHRRETDGHDPDIGNDVANAFEEIERRKEAACKEQERNGYQDCYDSGL